ncbi:Mg2 transporter protein, CorA-like/Zinc transport protein ZntB [Phaffia rhodozyma]|uniref:Mg2 transporter protein, CorA-like/Zinc transport protein ZntB n=1 Tax=Phaffia rhodozyma TaxID=264483 RepID=A0A0F7SSA3_PHARH|nr:Mg2 transporter protein, CorA-like/Zinc transport protein ZntB [Phaffia rhodozyma]
MPSLSSSPPPKTSNSPSAGLTLPSGRSMNTSHHRERQRAQDLDSAMALFRARSESISANVSTSPTLSSSLGPNIPSLVSYPSHTSGHSSDGSSGLNQSNTNNTGLRARHSSSHQGAGRSPLKHLDATQFPILSEAKEDEESHLESGTYIPEAAITDESDGRHIQPVEVDYAHRVPSSHDERDRSPPSPFGDEDETRSIGGGSTVNGGGTLGGGMTMNNGMNDYTIRRAGMNGGFVGRNVFDFSQFENWASKERLELEREALKSQPRSGGLHSRRKRNVVANEDEPYRDDPDKIEEEDEDEDEIDGFGRRQPQQIPESILTSSPDSKPASIPHVSLIDIGPKSPPKESQAFTRRRQRKLSQSDPSPHARRQGKLALFEGSAPVPHQSPLLKGPYQDNQRHGSTSSFDSHLPANGDLPSWVPQPVQREERPFRFSFYSNALPATIHARSISELPAEGQSFEDLFTGRETKADEESVRGDASENVSPFGTAPTNTTGGSSQGLLHKALQGAAAAGQGQTAGSNGGGGFSHGYSPKNEGSILGDVDGDPEASTWWLDVLCPTDDEMKMLSKVFGIHPLTTEDIQMEETREKIELFRNYYLVCFRSFDQDFYSSTHLEPLNLYLLVFREGVISFHFRATPHPQNVRRRIKQLKDYITVTSDWISYALIDDVTDAFGPLIQSIEYEVDSVDELVLIIKETEQSDMLRRIGTCRKKVMGLLRLMGNKADVVKGLAKRCNENWSVAPRSDIGLYLSDIQDHLITMTSSLNVFEKILSRAHSNYLAQISIEMTDANNKMNDVLGRMTALGTVLIPMNLVTGLWGMNVIVPGQNAPGLAWFWGIVGCLLAFALMGGFLTYRLFKP